MPDKLPTRRKIFDLVGEGQRNEDGSHRQDMLRACIPGDAVKLIREPENPYDRMAILVANSAGHGIGYLARTDAATIAPALDAGRTHRAMIHELRGGLPDYPNFGCRISIAWDDGKALSPVPLSDDQTLYGADSTRREGKAPGGCLGVGAMAVIVGATPYFIGRLIA